MSATVIDALLITLGLDPSGFTAGTNEVTKDLDKLKKTRKAPLKRWLKRGKKPPNSSVQFVMKCWLLSG